MSHHIMPALTVSPVDRLAAEVAAGTAVKLALPSIAMCAARKLSAEVVQTR